MPSSKGPSQPRGRNRVSSPALAGGFFTTNTTWEALNGSSGLALGTTRAVLKLH